MRLRELVATYDRLAATTKRLELRKELVALLKGLTERELPEVLYLSQGLLRPEYEGVELGVADSLALRAVALAAGVEEPLVKTKLRSSGDLGTTAGELLEERRRLDSPEPLEVDELHRALLEVARASGEGSQEAKVRSLVALLERAEPGEAKYVVRFVLGKLRLGVREMTILDALTEAFADGSKAARARVEAAFNVSSDLGVVAQALARSGLDGLDAIRLKVGRPIRPMLAERSPDLADLLRRMEGRAALEYKYDGLRVQAHVPAEGPVELFSRRLERISEQFPELLEELPKGLRRRPAIIEGECVAIDPVSEELQPFQEISRRRGRKYDLERLREEVPVCLFVFDLLLEGEEDLTPLDFPERRRRLERIVLGGERVRLATQAVAESPEAAQAFFDQAIADGCEGVMGKSLSAGSTYRAGARGFWWIKYKREYTQGLADSIDAVVVGAFYGRGKRAGRYGAFLMAVYDPDHDRYESFCKVGTGFDDAALASLPETLKPLERESPPSGVETGLVPDRWVEPKLVLELRGAELSLSPIHRAAMGAIRPGAGLALRFPRFTGRYRDDKGPQEATTARELLGLYRSQVRHAAETSADSPG